MTLRTSGHSDPSLIDRRVWIDLGFNAVNTVAGGARRGIRPTPGSHHPVDAFGKLLGDIRMARTAGLWDIRPKDSRFRINERPQIMAPMATRTVHLSCHSVDTLLEFVSGDGGPQRMVLRKLYIRMAAVARLIDVGNVDH